MALMKVAGVSTIEINGTTVKAGNTVSIDSFNVMKEPVFGLGGVAGYKESPRAPSMEIEVFLTSAFNLETVQQIENGTIKVQLPSGKMYTLNGAFLADAPVMNTVEGTTTLKFSGETMTQ